VSTEHRQHERHGKTGHPVHNVWRNMKKRCNSPSALNYPDYGGRGITIVEAAILYDEYVISNGLEHTLNGATKGEAYVNGA